MSWFYDTPVWITMPLFVGGFVVASCLVVWAMKPVVRRLVRDRDEWDRTLAHVIGTFGLFFGILLALVTVSVYENYAATRAVTVTEAGEVGALVRASTALPDEIGSPIRDELQAYLITVIEGDFVEQREGVLPDGSRAQVDAIEEILHGVEAVTGSEQAEYKQALEAFEAFFDARRDRIDATALALPSLIWVVIWVGAAVNAILIAFISVRSLRLHLLLAGLLAVFIGLVIFTTADMDRPYAGNVSVNAGAYERLYEQVFGPRG
ncbi:hypothetical protein GCM10009819_29220 [Agromyces tropicus]|uniref:DUF4239 domain-containing protein n=1 Tax=Agromyces tropicus TaxID=555371 RepID=A0ABP5G8W9_9MICO